MIVKQKAGGVLIDISTLEMVDSFIGRMLGTIAQNGAPARCRYGRGGHAAVSRHYIGRAGSFA